MDTKDAGRKGGRSRSAAKQAAGRKNILKAQLARLRARLADYPNPEIRPDLIQAIKDGELLLQSEREIRCRGAVLITPSKQDQ